MKVESAILIYDGYCNLCGAIVRFAKRHDIKGRIEFVPQSSERGRELMLQVGGVAVDQSTVVLIVGSRHYVRSDAALNLFRILGGGWQLLYGLIVIPRFIRDFVYRLIASTRYQIFGRSDSCHIP
jgi:predicted DCC family thiol-disulfide oxidoreductase YuxK